MTKHEKAWAPYVARLEEKLGLTARVTIAEDWRCMVDVMSPTGIMLFELTLSHPSYAPSVTHLGSKGALLYTISADEERSWFEGVA